jgi:hypothetical protein
LGSCLDYQPNTMKILEFINQTKASELAEQLLAEAKKHEPQITKDIKAVAKLNNAELIGLENKFKSELSLVRKLRDNSTIKGIPIEKIARKNNDALRYTLLFSPDDYAQNYKFVLDYLAGNGYETRKLWNAWNMQGKLNDTGYRGLNATIISSQNQIFELQFHTEESFRLKTDMHSLYEEKRNTKTSKKRMTEIMETTKELASKIIRPKGI